MSSVPPGLNSLQDYLESHVPGAFLGIVGDRYHTYGYHLGQDRIFSENGLGWSDYSVQHSRDRSSLSGYASAMDFGRGGWGDKLYSWTKWLVDQLRAGEYKDVREVIGAVSPGGRAYRWARENGWRAEVRSDGDDHEWHTHVSFYRDSARRDQTALVRDYIEEEDVPTAEEIVDELMSRVIEKVDPNSGTTSAMTFKSYVRWVHKNGVDAMTSVAAVLPQLAELQATVNGQTVLLKQLMADSYLSEEQYEELLAAVKAAAKAGADGVAAQLAAAGAALSGGE